MGKGSIKHLFLRRNGPKTPKKQGFAAFCNNDF